MIHLPKLIKFAGVAAIVDNRVLSGFWMRCVLVSLRGEEGFFLLLELPSLIYERWQFCLGFWWVFAGFEGFFCLSRMAGGRSMLKERKVGICNDEKVVVSCGK